MKRIWAVGIVMFVGVGAAFADDDPIKARRELMKANGDATKTIVGMLKGAPFDLASVKASLKVYANTAAKAPELFPDSSKSGDTNALPAIWDNKADFNARFAKFASDIDAASTGIVDQASFAPKITVVLKNCGGCHELYRAKTN